MTKASPPDHSSRSPIWPLPVTGAALSLLLFAIGAYHEAERLRGEEIVLETAPVDPRAVLLGHYVELAYEAETARALADIAPAREVRRMQTLLSDGAEHWAWAWFEEEQGGSWRLVRITLTRPEGPPGSVGVRVRARRSDMAASEPEGLVVDGISIRIGADRFYTDEQEAMAIETAARVRSPETAESLTDIRVILSVSSSGQPRLSGLIIDGRERRPGWL